MSQYISLNERRKKRDLVSPVSLFGNPELLPTLIHIKIFSMYLPYSREYSSVYNNNNNNNNN